MIFSSAVEFPASWRTSEMFVYSSAAPSVPPLPGVASLARGAVSPGTNGIQQAQQHQQWYHQHCGMAEDQRLLRKNEEILSGSWLPLKFRGPKARELLPCKHPSPRDDADSTAASEVGSSPCLCCCWKSLLRV